MAEKDQEPRFLVESAFGTLVSVRESQLEKFTERQNYLKAHPEEMDRLAKEFAEQLKGASFEPKK